MLLLFRNYLRRRRRRDIFDLLTRRFFDYISCYFISKIRAISCLKSWDITIICEIEEIKKDVMYLIVWHAMFLFISHVFLCLKFISFHISNALLFRVSNLNVWRLLARSKRTKKARCFWFVYTRFLSLYFSLLHVSNTYYFMFQMYIISCFKSWCITIVNEIKKREESAIYLIYWHAIFQFVCHVFQFVSHAIAYFKCVLLHVLNVCYFVSQILMNDDY